MRKRVEQEFERWATERGLVPAEPDAARQWRDRTAILLYARAEKLDRPDPTRWHSGDVHRLLMVHLVKSQVDAWGLAGHAVETVRSYLRFLDGTDRLHPASTRTAALLKELDRLAGRFPAAMADTSRYRLAKSVLTAVLADGLALDDGSGIDRWVERFNARHPAGRREVLGHLMAKQPEYGTGRLIVHDGMVALLRPGASASKHEVFPDAAGDDEPGPVFPPVHLPSEQDLAKSVADLGSGLLRQLDDLAGWVGDGRPVDHHGDLHKQDVAAACAHLGLEPVRPLRMGNQLALGKLWGLALEFDILALRRTRVVPGEARALVTAALRGEGTPEVLDLWHELFDEVVATSAGGPAELAVIQQWLDPWTPRFLGSLYRQGGGAVFTTVDDTLEDLTVEHADQIPPAADQFFPSLIATAVRFKLSELADHGAVEMAVPEQPSTGPVEACRSLGVAPWVKDAPARLRVRLTDLGRSAVRRRLLAEGATAPQV